MNRLNDRELLTITVRIMLVIIVALTVFFSNLYEVAKRPWQIEPGIIVELPSEQEE